MNNFQYYPPTLIAYKKYIANLLETNIRKFDAKKSVIFFAQNA